MDNTATAPNMNQVTIDESIPDMNSPSYSNNNAPPPEYDEYIYYLNEYDNVLKLGRGFKIHVIIGAIISCGIMIGWHWMRKEGEHLWWFIFPFSIFSTTIIIHYSILTKNKLNIIYALLWIVNITTLLVWPTSGYNGSRAGPYPIFIIFPSWLFRELLIYLTSDKENRNFFKFWVLETCIFSIFLYLIWLFYGGTFPWFIIMIIPLFTPILIFKVYTIDPKKRTWPVSAILCLMVCMMAFFIWEFTFQKIPWFIIPPGMFSFHFKYLKFLISIEAILIPPIIIWEKKYCKCCCKSKDTSSDTSNV